MDYQIYNAFPFEDGTEIISRLREETKSWDPNSVNELFLSFDPQKFSKNIITNDDPNILTDWRHIAEKKEINLNMLFRVWLI